MSEVAALTKEEARANFLWHCPGYHIDKITDR